MVPYRWVDQVIVPRFLNGSILYEQEAPLQDRDIFDAHASIEPPLSAPTLEGAHLTSMSSKVVDFQSQPLPLGSHFFWTNIQSAQV